MAKRKKREHGGSSDAKGLDKSPRAVRALAFVIDFFLGGGLSMLPCILVYTRLSGGKTLVRLTDFLDVGLDLVQIGLLVLAVLVISYVYYVVVPWKVMVGKTPGKRFCNIEIVMNDGSPATLAALTIRWLFMALVETYATLFAIYLVEYVAMVTVAPVLVVWRLLGLVATIVSAIVAWRRRDHAALHDLVAGTWVYTGL